MPLLTLVSSTKKETLVKDDTCLAMSEIISGNKTGAITVPLGTSETRDDWTQGRHYPLYCHSLLPVVGVKEGRNPYSHLPC
jgi:hypothetical protein